MLLDTLNDGLRAPFIFYFEKIHLFFNYPHLNKLVDTFALSSLFNLLRLQDNKGIQTRVLMQT